MFTSGFATETKQTLRIASGTSRVELTSKSTAFSSDQRGGGGGNAAGKQHSNVIHSDDDNDDAIAMGDDGDDNNNVMSPTTLVLPKVYAPMVESPLRPVKPRADDAHEEKATVKRVLIAQSPPQFYQRLSKHDPVTQLQNAIALSTMQDDRKPTAAEVDAIEQ